MVGYLRPVSQWNVGKKAEFEDRANFRLASLGRNPATEVHNVIAGIEPCSFIDFPNHLAAVLFLKGCNLHCPYCHNAALISTAQCSDSPATSIDTVNTFLRKRFGRLSAVVISGGEPTIHEDLPELIAEIRSMGYRIKLDTNGTNPRMLRRLASDGLLDYVAVDIKDVPARYGSWLARGDVESSIVETVTLLQNLKLNHEYRTTVVEGNHDLESLDEIRRLIGNQSRWYLQAARVPKTQFQQTCPSALSRLESWAVALRTRGATNLFVRQNRRNQATDIEPTIR